MSEQVTLPHEAAKELIVCFARGYSNYNIIKAYVNNELPSALLDCTIEVLMSALVNGYDVEKTPEEKVREYCEHALKEKNTRDHETSWIGEAKLEGVMVVLDAYGIKIPGVNIPEKSDVNA